MAFCRIFWWRGVLPGPTNWRASCYMQQSLSWLWSYKLNQHRQFMYVLKLRVAGGATCQSQYCTADNSEMRISMSSLLMLTRSPPSVGNSTRSKEQLKRCQHLPKGSNRWSIYLYHIHVMFTGLHMPSVSIYMEFLHVQNLDQDLTLRLRSLTYASRREIHRLKTVTNISNRVL